jgi:hypothetical protein
LSVSDGPVVSADLEQTHGDDLERGLNRVTGVAALIGGLAMVIAAATIWLLLTDPVTVATSVDAGEISPLVRQLAEVIFNALAGLLDYL